MYFSPFGVAPPSRGAIANLWNPKCRDARAHSKEAGYSLFTRSAERAKRGQPVGGAESRPPVTSPPPTRFAIRAQNEHIRVKFASHAGARSPIRRGRPCIRVPQPTSHPLPPLSALRREGEKTPPQVYPHFNLHPALEFLYTDLVTRLSWGLSGSDTKKFISEQLAPPEILLIFEKLLSYASEQIFFASGG